MLRALNRSRQDHLREKTQVLFFRPDRPRAIDRIIRYFGEAPAPALVAAGPLARRRLRPRQ
jgi:hypothetical protein